MSPRRRGDPLRPPWNGMDHQNAPRFFRTSLTLVAFLGYKRSPFRCCSFFFCALFCPTCVQSSRRSVLSDHGSVPRSLSLSLWWRCFCAIYPSDSDTRFNELVLKGSVRLVLPPTKLRWLWAGRRLWRRLIWLIWTELGRCGPFCQARTRSSLSAWGDLGDQGGKKSISMGSWWWDSYGRSQVDIGFTIFWWISLILGRRTAVLQEVQLIEPLMRFVLTFSNMQICLFSRAHNNVINRTRQKYGHSASFFQFPQTLWWNWLLMTRSLVFWLAQT